MRKITKKQLNKLRVCWQRGHNISAKVIQADNKQYYKIGECSRCGELAVLHVEMMELLAGIALPAVDEAITDQFNNHHVLYSKFISNNRYYGTTTHV